METPILTDMGRQRKDVKISAQSIYRNSPARRHRIGERGYLPDGRVFHYTRAGAANLAPGKLAMSEIVIPNAANLAVTATAAGLRKVNVTPGATGHNADAYAEGYLIVNDQDSEGYTYQIQSHPAITASVAFDLLLYDPIAVAFTNNTQVTLVKNPWADVVIAASGQAHLPSGIPTCTITAAEFGWLQTWGVCAGWDEAGAAIGDQLTSGATDGRLEAANADTEGIVATQLYTGVATEYYPKFLRIAS